MDSVRGTRDHQRLADLFKPLAELACRHHLRILVKCHLEASTHREGAKSSIRLSLRGLP